MPPSAITQRYRPHTGACSPSRRPSSETSALDRAQSQYRAALTGPLWAVCNEHSGEQGTLSFADFGELGVQAVGYELPIALVALKAAIDAARELRATGSIVPLLARSASFEEFLALAGFSEMEAAARRYGVIPAAG